MRLWLCAWLALAGCDQVFGVQHIATFDAPWCIAGQPGSFVGNICSADAPVDHWQPVSIDTASCSEVFDSFGSRACLIVARTIRIDAGTTVRFTGPDPVVLFGLDSLVVDGTIDVASHGTDLGAGAKGCPQRPIRQVATAPAARVAVRAARLVDAAATGA